MELDRYEILEPLGAGGMSEVFLARMRGVAGVDRLVAIKRMLPERLGNQAMQEMFVDEARISSRLRHSNIAQTLEFGKDQGYYFIVMEYVHGLSLSEIARRQSSDQITLAGAAFITARLCEALQYAHTLVDAKGRPLKIVHRDLNPGNVLVTRHGEVKLIDFGIARSNSRVHETAVGVLKGAVGYMSPEQVAYAPIDHRSDIFVAGTTLFELLLGRNPFICETKAATFTNISKVVIEPASWTTRVPGELARICARALERRPEDRYPSAGEMQEDLDGYCHTQGFGSRQLASWMAARFPELGVEPVLQTSRTTSVNGLPCGGTQLDSVVDARGETQLGGVVDARGGTQLESVVGLRPASVVADPYAAHAKGAYAPGQSAELLDEGEEALHFDEDASTQPKTSTGPLLTAGLPKGINIATVSLRGSGPLPQIETQNKLSIKATVEETVERQLPERANQGAEPTDPAQGSDARRRRRLWANLTLGALLLTIAGVIIWAINWDDTRARPQPAAAGLPTSRPSSPEVADLADRARTPTALAKRQDDAATHSAGRDAGVDAAPVSPSSAVVRPALTARKRRSRKRRRRRPRRTRKRRAPKKVAKKKASKQAGAAKNKVPAKKNLGDKGAQW